MTTPRAWRDAVRVIVVGPGALESALFAEPHLRVVRAPAVFDAIGELSDSTDPDFGRPTIVVISSEVEEVDPPAQFTRGLRMADPQIKVVRAESPTAIRLAPEELGYDAAVVRERAAEEVRRLAAELRADHEAPPAPSPTPAPRPDPVEPDARSASAEPLAAARSATEPEEVALVQALLAGHPIVPVAVEQLRARLGEPGAAFIPEGDPVPEGVAADVSWEGRRLGVLAAPSGSGASRGALEREAMRLAAWVRLEQQAQALQRAAMRDPLTDAWNRRYFDMYLERTIAEARRLRQPVTLMVFDIDGFKSFNDRFGHPAGDAILINAVRLLRTIVRPTDRVCRIGGDEFAVIFFDPSGPRRPGASPLTCQEMAERFQREVVAQRFPELGIDAPGTLTISGGMATFPWDATDAKALLARADELALQSKRTGKKKITIGPGVQRPR